MHYNYSMLSKTDYLNYLEAPMHLWAKAHDRLEDTTPSLYDQHLMRQGQQVEALARDYLQQVVLPQYENPQLLWQPVYTDGLYEIRADALVLDPSAHVHDLYEIKSSTSVKPDHIHDLAFQALVLEANLNLRDMFLLYIDKTYRLGQGLDLSQFFTLEALTDVVAIHWEEMEASRRLALEVSQLEKPGPDLACTKPETCPCPALCHPDLSVHPIYNLPRIGKKAVELRKMGITAIQDIPTSFNLNSNQQKHFQAVISGQPVIDHAAIRDALAHLVYPIYFLDYETYNPAVPLFEGYHPYEHIIFQYSLFVIAEPGAAPQHFDCLLTEREDPAPKLVPHLLSNLGPVGSVVVWNQSFEAQRNKELAGHCVEYAERLLGINERLYDLMLIFRNGHYVHPDFKGSASLKAVLPVICPDQRYDQLSISDGTEAMLTWQRLIQVGFPADEHARIEADMREYCKLDTYGMVVIWEALNDL